MSKIRIPHLALALGLSLLGAAAHAQTNAGFIRGTVIDPKGATIPNAVVRLNNSITNYTQTVETKSDGSYQLVDVPFNRYTLTVTAKGFEVSTQEVTVKSNLVERVDVNLGVATVRQVVTVDAGNDLLDVNRTAPATIIDRTRILSFPTSQPSRSTEKIVATAPGWTLDANNRLHARGIEYQVQYSIDGIPITDTIASTFAASPDPRNFRSVEVTTSNIPAEYGNKLAGVIELLESWVAIVGELSDIGKIDGGLIALARQPLDLFSLVGEVAELVHEASDREVHLELRGPSTGAPIVASGRSQGKPDGATAGF